MSSDHRTADDVDGARDGSASTAARSPIEGRQALPAALPGRLPLLLLLFSGVLLGLVSPAINDVAGGHITFMFSPIPVALPLVQARQGSRARPHHE
jgi:hypothetical protein